MSNCAEVEPLDRFSRFLAQPTCFRARRCLWGLERWVTYLGKYARNLKTWEGIGNIEPKCRNIKVAISQKLQVRSRVDLRIKLRPTMDFVADLTLLSSNPIWLPTAILKNSCDVITPPSVDQFWWNLVDWCRMITLIRKIRSESKPEFNEIGIGSRINDLWCIRVHVRRSIWRPFGIIAYLYTRNINCTERNCSLCYHPSNTSVF